MKFKKKQLKSETFNDKKVYKQKYLSVKTKNLVTFKRSHNDDLLLGGVVTKWWCLIRRGGGNQESGKKWLYT